MNCRVVILPTGQGAMNLIEIYDDQNRLVNLTLTDCGGDDGADLSKHARAESTEYAAGRMRERFENSRYVQQPAYLDHLIITHRDHDHWNMITNLLGEVFGGPVSAGSDQNGFLERKGVAGESHTYFVDRNTDVCFYQILSEDDCTINASVSYRSRGFLKGYTVQLEYIYEGEKLEIYYTGTNVRFSVLEEETEEVQISVSSCFRALLCFPGMQKILDDFENPKDISGLKELFSRLYQNGLSEYIALPKEHIMKIFAVLDSIWIGQDTIESIACGSPQAVPPVIRKTFIGGNSLAPGKKFRHAEQILTSVSGEINYGLEAGDFIPLYLHLGLYIIQRIQIWSLLFEVSSGSLRNNATSIVSVLVSDEVFECQKVVFTGDATAHTFYRMLCDLEKGLPEYYYENAVWTAPHHGSSATCTDMRSGIGGEVFQELLRETVPAAMVISAGVQNMHGHPGSSFVQAVSAFLPDGRTQEHFVYHNQTDQCRRLGADWDWLCVKRHLYSTFTLFSAEQGMAGKYAAYIIPFFEERIETVPAERLWEMACVQEAGLQTEKKEQLEMPFLSETEIPSEELFFRR